MSGALAPVQKVKKGRPLAGFPNTDPVVTITFAKSTVTVDVPEPSGEYTATAIDAEQGDIAASLVWTTLTVVAGEGSQIVNVGGEGGGVSTGLAADTAGFQAVDMGAAVASGTPTGLANDATVYTATVNPDAGGAQPIAVTGSAAQIYSTLITELDTDTTGASWSIVGGDLVCTSDTTGASSTIALVDTDLFLTLTGFSSILGAVAGTTTVYTASISVNGGEGQAIAVTGELAQTYTALVGQLNIDTTGAVWDLSGISSTDGPRAISDASGASSSIAITAGTLFPALTNFVAILAAVAGTDAVFGTIGTGAAPAGMTFPLVGVQTVTATVTDGFGATDFDTAGVTVTPPV